MMSQEFLLNSNSPAGSVAEFYNGKTVFITGGTGFVGKVIVEKLLRSCPGISKIYLLIRPKKGQNIHERLTEVMGSPLFDIVRKELPNNMSKVLPMKGDITQPKLGLNEDDVGLLSKSVNIVFHSAATVKFNEKLKLAVTINMLGTQRLVELCREMLNLKAMIHISTAFCNCDRSKIEEVIYPPPIDPDKLVAIVESSSEEFVDSITPELLGKRPNTYTFTKALSECWLKENKGDLPLVIVRPSVILSSLEEPVKGWLDSWGGPTGLVVAAGKGILRTMFCEKQKVVDIVPVDIVTNLIIVSAWRIASRKTNEILVYNCVTGQRKPIKWIDFINLCSKYYRIHRVSNFIWSGDSVLTSSRIVKAIKMFLLQLLPAFIIDFFQWITGGKPILVKLQSKLISTMSSLEPFTINEWDFHDRNVRALSFTLNEADRKVFYLDVDSIDWETYTENYVLGIRRFMLEKKR